jgi:hypothetical protein
MHLLWQLNGMDYYSIYYIQEVQGLENLRLKFVSFQLALFKIT